MTSPAPRRLGALHALVRELERDGRVRPAAATADGEGPAAVATGWPGLDANLGTFEGAPGLARGALHEWFGAPAPRVLLAQLAARALEERLARPAAGRTAVGRVLWIGRSVWPFPATLLACDRLRELSATRAPGLSVELALDEHPCVTPASAQPLFARSLFVDPKSPADRLWAVDAALRTPSVTAVVADGSGFDMPATRRLSLAANTGEALVLLARPPREEAELSAASTRWRVRPTTAAGSRTPAWRIELVRLKPPQTMDRSTRPRARDSATACPAPSP